MAGSKYIHIARKLQTACKKLFGVKLLIDQRQWYHKEKDTAITVYTLYQVDDSNKKIKLFQTYSQVQLVLFLRDFWYVLNGWEVPTDNPVWEDLKKKYGEKENTSFTGSTEELGGEQWGTECNRTTVCDELYKNWKRNRSSTENTEPARTDT